MLSSVDIHSVYFYSESQSLGFDVTAAEAQQCVAY